MAGSLNKVQLIGNLGKDPEVRFTADNTPIANLTLATSESWQDKAGQRQERTEWHRVVVFGKLAEVVQKYVKKGDSVYFEGKLQTRKWTDKENQERYTTEIVVDRGGTMVMLGGKGGSRSAGPADESHDNSGFEAAPAATNAAAKLPAQTFDDDIPF